MNSAWFGHAELIAELHAAHAHGDHRADLQQPEPDRVRAGARELGAGEPEPPQRLHQHVGGRGEPQPQLVGAEGRGGEPIGKQIELRP